MAQRAGASAVRFDSSAFGAKRASTQRQAMSDLISRRLAAAPSSPERSGLTRALLLTFGALALYFAGRHVPLPGLDAEAVARLTKPHGLRPELFSIFAIGVTPL